MTNGRALIPWPYIHEPPNPIDLSLFLCLVSIKVGETVCVVTTCVFDRCAHVMPCDQALFLHGSSSGVTCLFTTGWLFASTRKTNCSNEVQGNYVGDIAFASASSLGSVTRSCERSIFSKTKIVWRCCGCAVSAPAQCCTSFQFIFVWCGQYTCVAQQKNLADAWRTRRRRDSFFRP